MSRDDAPRDFSARVPAGAEREDVREFAARALGVTLQSESFTLAGGADAWIDGVSPDRLTYIEICDDLLSGAELPATVARAALKLLAITARMPAARCYLVMTAQAAATVQACDWLSDALRAWNVTLLVR